MPFLFFNRLCLLFVLYIATVYMIYKFCFQQITFDYFKLPLHLPFISPKYSSSNLDPHFNYVLTHIPNMFALKKAQ